MVGQGQDVVGARVLAAAVGVMDEAEGAGGPALAERHPSASRTRSVRMWAANCQPTIRRENASRTKAKKTTPSQQRR
jgi:hypothetical protein